MKDPLDYTEEELYNLSIEELVQLKDIAENKESLFNTEQTVLKLTMNSLFGAWANRWFPLFNEDMACAITGNGRYFIRKLANYIENTLQSMHKSEKNYIVSGDTDSVYFHIEPFMAMYKEKNPNLSINEYVDWADTFEKKVIQPCIQSCIKDFCTELNAYNPDIIGVEREIIADKMILCAKKKYFGRVRDSEGTRYPEDDPYIKVMGLEIIKGTTPTWSKKYLKESIPHILDKNEDDLRNWILTIKGEYIKVNLEDIASHGGVSRLDYNIADKGVPFGSRAAIKHNMYIKNNNLEASIEPIQAGDKCKRMFLLEPNSLNTNIIAFNNINFIKEFKDYVDYDTQFEKTFLKPLSLMTDCLNYNLEKETENLDDW